MANYKRMLKEKLLEEHVEILNNYAHGVRFKVVALTKGMYSLHKNTPQSNKCIYDSLDIDEMMTFIEGMIEGISTERHS